MPSEPLRWSVLRASQEFHIDISTLKKRLGETDAIAGPDGCFSTLQILGAVSGDILAQRYRKLKAEATNMELRNLERQGALLPKDEVFRCWSALALLIKNEIWSCSEMPEHTRRSILSHLAESELPETS